MCMTCSGNKSNSYTPKKMTTTKTTTSQAKVMKGWGGTGGSNRGGNFGTPKVKMSFGRR